jgi:hypothetical protein
MTEDIDEKSRKEDVLRSSIGVLEDKLKKEQS